MSLLYKHSTKIGVRSISGGRLSPMDTFLVFVQDHAQHNNAHGMCLG